MFSVLWMCRVVLASICTFQVIISCFFFLMIPRPPRSTRTTPSFPTRRSSDVGEWVAGIVDAGKREVTLEVVEQMRPREEVPDFWLCPALLKKDRFDLVLEKATELGAAQIRPVIMRRCVADKLNLERARVITTEAAEQCARTALPEVLEPLRLESMLRGWPPNRMIFYADEDGGEPASAAFARHEGPAALLIGPEGGIDPAERALPVGHPPARPLSSEEPRVGKGSV